MDMNYERIQELRDEMQSIIDRLAELARILENAALPMIQYTGRNGKDIITRSNSWYRLMEINPRRENDIAICIVAYPFTDLDQVLVPGDWFMNDNTAPNGYKFIPGCAYRAHQYVSYGGGEMVRAMQWLEQITTPLLSFCPLLRIDQEDDKPTLEFDTGSSLKYGDYIILDSRQLYFQCTKEEFMQKYDYLHPITEED